MLLRREWCQLFSWRRIKSFINIFGFPNDGIDQPFSDIRACVRSLSLCIVQQHIVLQQYVFTTTTFFIIKRLQLFWRRNLPLLHVPRVCFQMADVPRPHRNILLHLAAPQRQRQQHPVHFLHLFMRVGLAHDTQLETAGGEGHGAMGL